MLSKGFCVALILTTLISQTIGTEIDAGDSKGNDIDEGKDEPTKTFPDIIPRNGDSNTRCSPGTYSSKDVVLVHSTIYRVQQGAATVRRVGSMTSQEIPTVKDAPINIHIQALEREIAVDVLQTLGVGPFLPPVHKAPMEHALVQEQAKRPAQYMVSTGVEENIIPLQVTNVLTSKMTLNLAVVVSSIPAMARLALMVAEIVVQSLMSAACDAAKVNA
ncbi:hypothetical protein CVT25_015043 [Psilocybe cyanescens]|uniref:Uncharacterized protein n=1 Tax=Psilocybe cyanescens TaxID=93625 RepID=A0A409VPK5_PSICY|nr:hypothetical protein CVT25_015043 [Psilocybe cyanescens]